MDVLRNLTVLDFLETAPEIVCWGREIAGSISNLTEPAIHAGGREACVSHGQKCQMISAAPITA
jgi:hypothetical protein